MVSPTWIDEYEYAAKYWCDSRQLRLIIHIREQGTELARLRGVIEVREDALRQFTKTIDEQDKALAEARKIVGKYFMFTDGYDNDIAAWIKAYDLAHPTPNEG
jgi:hypothetical protein